MTLKTAFEPYFKVGAALNRWDIADEKHIALVKEQFSSITSENEMKPMFFLDNEENLKDPAKYDTDPAMNYSFAKKYLEFAKSNGLALRGHTLVWHNQTPKWFFRKNYDAEGELADRETMLLRLENYIKHVLTFVQTEYPGIIYAWDVVNEIVDEGAFRKRSPWVEVLGEDFFLYAFTFARKYADPNVLLFYNDYESATAWKRDFIIEHVLKPLMDKGLVDGMGMQAHMVMDHPTMEEVKTAVEMYGALGLQIHFTELDIHNADPGEESMQALANRYHDLFQVLVTAKKEKKANITCVTFWNLLDEESWLTGFRRETSYPLLFHGDCEPKAAYYAVLDVVK